MQNPDEGNKPHTMTITALAEQYGISRPTLRAWWERAGIDIPKNIRVLTPAQVADTYKKCGEP